MFHKVISGVIDREGSIFLGSQFQVITCLLVYIGYEIGGRTCRFVSAERIVKPEILEPGNRLIAFQRLGS